MPAARHIGAFHHANRSDFRADEQANRSDCRERTNKRTGATAESGRTSDPERLPRADEQTNRSDCRERTNKRTERTSRTKMTRLPPSTTTVCCGKKTFRSKFCSDNIKLRFYHTFFDNCATRPLPICLVLDHQIYLKAVTTIKRDRKVSVSIFQTATPRVCRAVGLRKRTKKTASFKPMDVRLSARRAERQTCEIDRLLQRYGDHG